MRHSNSIVIHTCNHHRHCCESQSLMVMILSVASANHNVADPSVVGVKDFSPDGVASRVSHMWLSWLSPMLWSTV